MPVAAPVTASGQIRPGALPGGRYAVLRHTGPCGGLLASNTALQEWAHEHGIEFDAWDTPAGSAWRGRAEHLTDPSREPDPAKSESTWRTWSRERVCVAATRVVPVPQAAKERARMPRDCNAAIARNLRTANRASFGVDRGLSRHSSAAVVR